ncbi:FAD-dependent oxidoreductase [Thiomicrorhabdus xiamenensis]|uniref:D-amino-acid oxidase n=1 Tax=Thiomicrorhabdus xiamenensis TaxID=2739063 RepID=A0A7D4T134_9GAMM|nr:FAD-dependent oxidoreductase [Thiomicrorhabdus xiamenensis]QKI89265.1 FAD-dependent oxidoreductase [Thiomicrorhabdus xiamenensis]
MSGRIDRSAHTGCKPKIAILGAGLIGRLLAFSLKDEMQIDLFDQDDGRGELSAAYLAAAMLAPLAESAESGTGIMQLGEIALELWPKILQALPQKVFFQRNGSLLLAFEQDRASLETLQKNLKGDHYRRIDRAEITTLEPEINQRFAQGLFLPDEGQLDNRQLLAVLGDVLRAHANINWQTEAFVQLIESELLINGDLRKGYDWIIDCRGLGACKDSQPDLRGVRGEVARVHAPQVTLRRPVRLMHPRYPIYIAPKPNHHFVIGATQIETQDQRQPTVRSTLELLSSCFSVHSGFAEAEILQIQSGLRPAYLHNEPQMRVDGNVISLNGLFRHGYLLSPVLVDLCRSYLLDQPMDGRYLGALPELVQGADNGHAFREAL